MVRAPGPPGGMSAPVRPPAFMIFRLALADLRHEWVLNLCLMLSLAAVLAPLLILFGLKQGTIRTLRERLKEDPLKREIIPQTSLAEAASDPAWFGRLAQRPDVGFLVPMTRQLANQVLAQAAQGRRPENLAVFPTAPGDPLAAASRVPIPGPGQVLLSASAAERLRAKVGDTIELIVEASDGAAVRAGRTKVTVTGVLEERATREASLFAPLDLLEAIEAYKDGEAVPALGWNGREPVAEPAYDGVIVALPEPIAADRKAQLLVNTGLARIEELDAARLREIAGWTAAEPRRLYWLFNERASIGDDNLAAVREQLRGARAEVFPWIRPLEVELAVAGSPSVRMPLAALPAGPPGVSGMVMPAGAESGVFTVHPPAAPAAVAGVLSFRGQRGALEIPVKLLSPSGSPLALAPLPLIASLRRAAERPVRFDAVRKVFFKERHGHASFRLYARTIEDVEPLRRHFEGLGLRVATQSERILEVIELDRQLTRMFWLIAVVGIVGGVAALVASLFASVERKRRALSILRLVGLPRLRLTAFPLYQSQMLALAGFGLALAAYAGIALAINLAFRSQLQDGESFCRLAPGSVLAAAASALLLAFGAAILAAIRVSSADPAEALREE